jgi:hypothetical protein
MLAAFVLLCQAAAWVHAAAIPHVTCVEHGESVHLDAQGEASAPRGDAGATVLAEAADEATAHAHEHCNLQGHRTSSTPPPVLADVVATAIVPAAPTTAAPLPAVSLLRLAPKTSPPRTPVA